MIIQHNMHAINANRILGMNNTKLAGTLEKLSSGYQINRSADNAAGLAISEKMRTMIHGITQAEKNCHDAVSLVQTAEGALNEVHSMLQRMNELANQSANGTYNDRIDRASLQLEFDQIQEEIDHIAEHTDFNGMKLFDGTGGTYTLSDGNTVTNYVKKDIPTFEELFADKTGELENIVYTETVFDFETTQSPSGEATNKSPSGWAEAAATLQTQIVPQAVKAIMSKYTAFNYLTGSSIGIGLELYSNSSSTTLASVGLARASVGGEVIGLGYQLSVNMAAVDLSTEEGRSALESTIAHEMIHAFMDEALTAGMTGDTGSGTVSSQKFPMWFIEGMAQTASGPGNWTWAMGIDGNATKDEISSALKSSDYALSRSASEHGAQYGTGYLACMYLGYLAAGADANMNSSTAAASDIAGGLSSMLSKIISGKSLNDTIKEVTGGKYTNISAFESGFATDDDALNFIMKLQEKGYITKNEPKNGYVNVVNGGLISGDLMESDPYANGTISGLKLFALDTGNDMILNQYPDDVNILSGGTASTEGVAPIVGSDTPKTYGDFTVTGGTEGVDFEYDEATGTLTVKTGTALTIEGSGNATTDKIKIADGTTANVTIKNVNIDVSSTSGACAFEVGDGATLNLTLDGANTLKSGNDCAGLQVGEGETLIITENSTGYLNATGGGLAAGIGGGYDGSGGTIDINAGFVTAIGGIGAAGIGGGRNGSGGNIDINAGFVTAIGGIGAAGIGGGRNGSGGNIEISGGEVTAAGGSNAVAIGNGQNGTGGTFSTGTNGSADITVSNADGDTEIADLISDTSGIDNWSATINGVQYPKALEGTGNIDLSTLTDDLEIIDGGYKIGNKTYTYSGDYTFTGTTDKNITVSNGGTTNISLDGATLGEFAVKGNSTVNMNVTGENTAGDVYVEKGSKLNVTGDGTLNADGLINKGTLNNDSTINNDGAMENEGTLTNGENGTINNDSSISNSGTIKNNGTIDNSGDISNTSKGNIENSGDIINASGGTIDNSGEITNKSGGVISNSGDVANNDGGTINNDGDITNGTGGTITNASGGTIDNNGDIDNTGGTLTNDGEIKSRPDSKIDGTVDGTQPTDAPDKATEGENVWVMQTGGRSKDTLVMDIGKMNTKTLGVHKDDINIKTQIDANIAIDRIGEAVNKLSIQRADIGAYQKRLEHKIDNLNVTRENLIAAESKIRDTDMAAYMMAFTKNQILNNTAQAMLAQATSLPQGVMSLIQ